MTTARLKDVAYINRRSLPEHTSPDHAFRYVDITSVAADGTVSVPRQFMLFGSAPSRARRLAPPGSTIVSTVRTYLRAIARVPRTSEPLVFSTGFAVLEPMPGIDSGYLYYACRTEPFIQDVVARSVGISYPAINATYLGTFRIRLPPLDEQRRIADFLDAETARLECISLARQDQQKLLDDRELSLLHKFTSLSENDKPRVRHVTTRITSGPRGWGERVGNSGTPFLRIANLPRYGVDLELSDLALVEAAPGPERERTRTRLGDVLLSITADIGSVGLVSSAAVDANVSQHVALLRPRSEVCSPRWLAYALKTPATNSALKMSSYGGAKVGLSLTDVADVRVPLPPLPDQVLRTQQIDKEMSRISRLRAAIRDQLLLLGERKQALITAAVNGQIDVTTARGVDV